MALQDALSHYGRFNRSPSRESNLLASEVAPFKPSCVQCDPFIPWNTVCPREMTTDSRFQDCGCQQKTSLKFEPYVSVKENNLHESNSGGTCKLPLTPVRDLDILELMEELKSSSKLPRFSSATGSIVDPFQMAPGRGKWYNLSNNSLSSNSSATFPRSQRKLQIANASLTPSSSNLTNIAKGDACGTSQCTSKHLLPIISVPNSACRTSSCSQDPQHNVTSFPAFLPSELVESMDDLPSATCSTKSSMSEVLQDDGDFRRCNEKLSWSSIAKSGQGYADLTTLSEVIDPSMTELPKIAAPARISSRRPAIASDDFTAAAATQMHEGTEESTAWLSKDEDMENFNASEGGEAAVDSIGVAQNDISNTPEHNLGSQYFINTQKYAGQCRAFPSPDQFRAQRPESSFVANSAPFALNAENICTAELLPAGKEMLYRAAALQPLINLSAEVISKPKRRNVRISKDPQSVAARHRRERISDRIRILQRLVPGGTKMDTASMLDEAVLYVKYLKMQIQAMEVWSYTAGVGWPVPSSSYIGSASTRWEMGSQTGVSSTVKGDCSWKLGSKPAIGGSNYKKYIGE